MKNILILISLIPLLSYGQDRDFKWWVKRYNTQYPLSITGGVLNATTEIKYYRAFQLSVPLRVNDPQPWWVYFVDFTVSFGVEAMAFEVTNKVYRTHLD